MAQFLESQQTEKIKVYEDAIAKLEIYSGIPTAKSIYESAVQNLVKKRNEIIDSSKTVMEIPHLYTLLRENPENQYETIAHWFFNHFEVNGENFISIDQNLYSLRTESGIYIFKLMFVENVIVFKRLERGGRHSMSSSYSIDHLPTLNETLEEQDLNLLNSIIQKMGKRLNLCWKYLQEPQTPSTLTSISGDEVEEILEIN